MQPRSVASAQSHSFAMPAQVPALGESLPEIGGKRHWRRIRHTRSNREI